MLWTHLPAMPSLYSVTGLCTHLLPSAKVSIYKFLATHFSTPPSCEVTWDWAEPETVGKPVTFSLRFFQKNDIPHHVSETDAIVVEVVHEGVMVVRTMEFPGESFEEQNLVRCGFTAHKAGDYHISVLVGEKHVEGSPFTRSFAAGTVEASQTGFTRYTSTVVVCCGASYPFVIEPRDLYGNLTAYTTSTRAFFKMKIKDAGSQEWFSPATQIVYSRQDKTLVMYIMIDRTGCYQARVTYGDKLLSNGQFNILVLSATELQSVHKNITNHKHNLWHEARLLAKNGQPLDVPKKVYVHTTAKHITITEMYLKVYPRKLCVFRVGSGTKFGFRGVNSHFEAPTFVIEDGAQTSVELASKDCSVIAATYACFLWKSIGGSETFNDKRHFFYKKVRAAHPKRRHSCRALTVERSSLLESSYKAIKHFRPSDWCQRFEITFCRELGLDLGGVSKEWFELLCQELFDPNRSQLFTRFSENPQGLVHPNARRPPDRKAKLYEFAGQIVAKCLFDSAVGRTQLVKARFTRSFLAQLIGRKVTYKHFETDDPEYYVSKIAYIEQNDVTDLELTFSEETYNAQGQITKVANLIPKGSRVAVTNDNKLLYLDALAQHRLVTPVREEVNSFKRGLSSEVIPGRLLSLFDERELETLLCGTGTYSVAQLKHHHNVVGTAPSFNKVLGWFWTIITSFSEDQMARLLQFTTGSSQLPPGGFAELSPKIQLSPVPTYNNLPSSHTCFNQLCLPNYDSLDTFRKMLLLAITEGGQGFEMA